MKQRTGIIIAVVIACFVAGIAIFAVSPTPEPVNGGPSGVGTLILYVGECHEDGENTLFVYGGKKFGEPSYFMNVWVWIYGAGPGGAGEIYLYKNQTVVLGRGTYKVIELTSSKVVLEKR
jgi:hypothetical protein